MRRYETIVISHPSLSQEERQPFFDKLTDLISEGEGLLVKTDEWGQKRLAYEIKKQTRGYYVLLEYCGNGTLVKELERNIRLDDRSLKYMTVCVAEDVDRQKVEEEIEAAEKAKAEAAKPAPEVPPEQEAPVQETETSEPTEKKPEPEMKEEAADGAHETDE
jgi:small subunit ribosomal protein S6